MGGMKQSVFRWMMPLLTVILCLPVTAAFGTNHEKWCEYPYLKPSEANRERTIGIYGNCINSGEYSGAALARIHSLRGGLLKRMGNFEDALPDATAAIAIASDSAPPEWVTLAEQQGLAEGQDIYSGIRLDQAIYYLLRGEIRLGLGMVEDAVSDFRVASSYDGPAAGTVRIPAQIVESVVREGSAPSAAMEFLELVKDAHPEVAGVLILEAQVMAMVGQVQRSLELFDEAIPQLQPHQIWEIQEGLVNQGFRSAGPIGTWTESDQLALEQCLSSGCSVGFIN